MAFSANLTPFQTRFAAKYGFAFQKQSMNALRTLKPKDAASGQIVYHFDHSAARTCKPALLLHVPENFKENEKVDAIDLVTGTKCSVFIAHLKDVNDALEAQIQPDDKPAVEVFVAASDMDIIEISTMSDEATAEKRTKKETANKALPEPAPQKPEDSFEAMPETHDSQVVDEIPFAETPEENPALQADTEFNPFEENSDIPSGDFMTEGLEPIGAGLDGGAVNGADLNPEPAPEAAPAKGRGKAKKEPAKPREDVPKGAKEPSDIKFKFHQGVVHQLLEEIPVRCDAAKRLCASAANAKDGENPWEMLRHAQLELDAASIMVARAINRGDVNPNVESRFNPMLAVPSTNVSKTLAQAARDVEHGYEKPKTWDELKKTLASLKKDADSMVRLMHQPGIADTMKDPSPRLKASDGTAIENVQ